jgi:N-methylhydantoinase A
MAQDRFRIGIDIGGTFTDCTVYSEASGVRMAKAPSTPDDFSQGFFNALAAGAESIGISLEELLTRTERLSHGTTVGINAVVSRTGSRVGLIATKGHGDALRILDNTGRTNGMPVERILDYASSSLPERFVKRGDVAEITERIDCFGDVVVPLDVEHLEREAERLLGQGVETLAVSYLWSHLNATHEDASVAFLADRYPDVYVSSGAKLAQKIGEYPRTATAVINSYIGPLMRDYVGRLLRGLRERNYLSKLLFAQCDGGLIDADDVIDRPVMTLESGPVGGVIACEKSGEEIGEKNIIAADMGGTTFDVSVIADGRRPVRDGVVIEQHDLFLRMVDVESVGAGGGSIAWIDPQSGALRVGPRSAGAVPGPVCYGRGGTEPTVTDADLVLGLVNPENFLGGKMNLDIAAAEAAIAGLGEKLGLGTLECAAGIQEIADSLMEDKIRSMTLAKGHDPRDFTVYAFGGGGALHAGLFCRGLGIRRVMIPVGDLASVWSAYGIGLEGYGRTYEFPEYLRAPFDVDEVRRNLADLTRRAEADCEESEIDWGSLAVTRSADLKYALQVFDVETELPDGEVDEEALTALVSRFERIYADRFGEGAGYPEGGIDMVGLRLRVEPREPLKVVAPSDLVEGRSVSPSGTRDVFWPELGEVTRTPVYDGPQLPVSALVEGPAVVDFPDTTVVVRPDHRLTARADGNLLMELED